MTDAETTEQTRKKREREALALLFVFLLSDTRHHLTLTVSAFLAGTTSGWRMADGLATTLTSAHTQAAWLGRRLAGNRAPMGAADVQFGQSAMRTQVRYLSGMVDKLRRGEFALDENGDLPGGLANRISLYVKRLRGTAEEAWLAVQPDVMISWVLDKNENHCEDCPKLAAAGPYVASRMPTTPGRGDTPCLANCKCYLVNQNGERCFELPEGAI